MTVGVVSALFSLLQAQMGYFQLANLVSSIGPEVLRINTAKISVLCFKVLTVHPLQSCFMQQHGPLVSKRECCFIVLYFGISSILFCRTCVGQRSKRRLDSHTRQCWWCCRKKEQMKALGWEYISFLFFLYYLWSLLSDFFLNATWDAFVNFIIFLHCFPQTGPSLHPYLST